MGHKIFFLPFDVSLVPNSNNFESNIAFASFKLKKMRNKDNYSPLQLRIRSIVLQLLPYYFISSPTLLSYGHNFKGKKTQILFLGALMFLFVKTQSLQIWYIPYSCNRQFARKQTKLIASANNLAQDIISIHFQITSTYTCYCSSSKIKLMPKQFFIKYAYVLRV